MRLLVPANRPVVQTLPLSRGRFTRIIGGHVSAPVHSQERREGAPYWSIVENRPLNDGRVIQRHVLYVGEMNSSQEQAWRKSIEVFAEGCEQPRTIALFPEDRCEGLLADESVVRLRLSELRLHRPRQWWSVLAGA